MLSGFFSLLGAVFIGRACVRSSSGKLRLVLYLGAAPMVLAMALYLLLLFFPGISPGSASLIMAVGLIAIGSYCLFLDTPLKLPDWDTAILIPLAFLPLTRLIIPSSGRNSSQKCLCGGIHSYHQITLVVYFPGLPIHPCSH